MMQSAKLTLKSNTLTQDAYVDVIDRKATKSLAEKDCAAIYSEKSVYDYENKRREQLEPEEKFDQKKLLTPEEKLKNDHFKNQFNTLMLCYRKKAEEFKCSGLILKINGLQHQFFQREYTSGQENFYFSHIKFYLEALLI